MEHLFPGLELGRSTREAYDEALRETDAATDIVTLDSKDPAALARACAEPGARVVVPADAAQMRAVVRALRGEERVHLRVDDRPTPVVYDSAPVFALGRTDTLRSGDDVAILATGLMVAAAVVAHDRLAEMGVGARVVNVASLRPLDAEAVAGAARETGAVVTAEEGWIDGGLGSAVAELLARHPVPMEHVGLDANAVPGGADALLAHGLTAAHIMGAVHDAMERKASPGGGVPG